MILGIKLFKFAQGRGIATQALGEDPNVFVYLELRKELKER